MKKRAILNFSVSLIYQLLNLLIGLVLPKFYTETFGSVFNGLNQSVSQIMSLLSVLQFGIAASAIQQMFQFIADKDEEGISGIYWETGKQYRKMGYVFIGVVIPVIAVFPFIIKDSISYWIIVSFLVFRTVSSAMEYFFQAKYGVIIVANNRSYAIYVFNIIILLLNTLLHFVVLFTFKNILIYQAVTVFTTLVRLLLVSSYIRRKFPYLYKHKHSKKKIPKDNNRKDVLISEIAGVVIDSTDLLTLSAFSGLIYTSIYSVYSFVTSGIGNVLGSCREAVFAGLGKTYFQDREKYQKDFDQFESIYFFLTFFLYSTTIILFRPFIEVYTANMDAQYFYYGMPILFVVARLIVGLRIPAIVTINTAGHFKQVKKYAVIESIINVTVSLSLVYFLNIYGVLIGTIIAALYRTPLIVRYSDKNILKRSGMAYFKKLLKWMPILICSYLLSIFVPIKCTSLINWVIIAVPVSLAVLVCSLLWMVLIDIETFKRFIVKLKHINHRKE